MRANQSDPGRAHWRFAPGTGVLGASLDSPRPICVQMCILTVWHAEIASVTLETSVLCNRDVIERIPMVCSQNKMPLAVSSHTLVTENAESTLTGEHI